MKILVEHFISCNKVCEHVCRVNNHVQLESPRDVAGSLQNSLLAFSGLYNHYYMIRIVAYRVTINEVASYETAKSIYIFIYSCTGNIASCR